MIDEKKLLSEIAKTCPESYGIVENVVNRMRMMEVVRARTASTTIQNTVTTRTAEIAEEGE